MVRGQGIKQLRQCQVKYKNIFQPINFGLRKNEGRLLEFWEVELGQNC